jgi:septum formation protein
LSRVILASGSRARAVLLTGAGVPFEAVSPNVDEAELKAELTAQAMEPAGIAAALAEHKALSVRADGALVIGADQTLELDGALFDKPQCLGEARQHLEFLRGRTHKLHSAVVLADGGRPVWSEIRTARLKMRNFSDGFLGGYLQREGDAILASVGGYRLEGEGVQLFEAIDGDYFTILGLPLLGLLDTLRSRGVLPG